MECDHEWGESILRTNDRERGPSVERESETTDTTNEKDPRLRERMLKDGRDSLVREKEREV